MRRLPEEVAKRIDAAILGLGRIFLIAFFLK
jgi:hypothetical protein